MEYEIYQIENIENCKYAFASFETAKKNHLHSNFTQDYKHIYTGHIKDDEDIEYMLERIFQVLNIGKKPENFNGHSLSVSDVVKINGKKYYCDLTGWRYFA